MEMLFLIFAFVCLIIGSVFVLLHRYTQAKYEAQGRDCTGESWATLTGTETRSEMGYNHRIRQVTYGTYHYITADGQNISAVSGFGYSGTESLPGADGRPVKIRYNPKNPEEFIHPEEQVITGSVLPIFRKVGILLLILGIVFSLAAVAAWLGVFDSLHTLLSSPPLISR